MMGAHREALEQARLADGRVANEHKLEDVIVLLSKEGAAAGNQSQAAPQIQQKENKTGEHGLI